MKTAITAGLLFALLFAAAPLQAKQAAIQQTEARALSGNITAQITLADTFRAKQDIVQAKYWYRKAAEQNNPYAQNEPGKLILLSDQSVTSLQEAKVWFEKAASQNQPDALYQPGVMYYRGKGCERGDCVIARNFYERAAAQSHGPAQFYLAMMYLRGHGVAQDYEKGVALMKASCGNDEPEACPWVKNLTENEDKFRQIFSGKQSSDQPPR
ncbi:tetratricopeptide repeat protein [Morganella morganii]|uniref:tetratricopeptide repeat protein n=1 Tax=Morganella morganii TaxID=582 RepID=UPI001BD64C4C|nr:tetratricopeptide repeat protein [Morganella morganii]